ncbi:hypothetical protein SCAB_54811 [Streptomyces scabiei 87.22]|uniref:Uncharacterized protein n=1 Tax=Streptomyces scabiei (strain 87.22) TaxID=680198 RepID=C9YZF5_STRSW|nr:hypothetical protein SCAB_54811 [Streptomyces scabiei 87.22]
MGARARWWGGRHRTAGTSAPPHGGPPRVTGRRTATTGIHAPLRALTQRCVPRVRGPATGHCVPVLTHRKETFRADMPLKVPSCRYRRSVTIRQKDARKGSA